MERKDNPRRPDKLSDLFSSESISLPNAGTGKRIRWDAIRMRSSAPLDIKAGYHFKVSYKASNEPKLHHRVRPPADQHGKMLSSQSQLCRWGCREIEDVARAHSGRRRRHLWIVVRSRQSSHGSGGRCFAAWAIGFIEHRAGRPIGRKGINGASQNVETGCSEGCVGLLLFDAVDTPGCAHGRGVVAILSQKGTESGVFFGNRILWCVSSYFPSSHRGERHTWLICGSRK